MDTPISNLKPLRESQRSGGENDGGAMTRKVCTHTCVAQDARKEYANALAEPGLAGLQARGAFPPPQHRRGGGSGPVAANPPGRGESRSVAAAAESEKSYVVLEPKQRRTKRRGRGERTTAKLQKMACAATPPATGAFRPRSEDAAPSRVQRRRRVHLPGPPVPDRCPQQGAYALLRVLRQKYL
jgi:hypothetical protein